MAHTKLDFTASDRTIIARTDPARHVLRKLVFFGVLMAVAGAVAMTAGFGAVGAVLENSVSVDPTLTHGLTETRIKESAAYSAASWDQTDPVRAWMASATR